MALVASRSESIRDTGGVSRRFNGCEEWAAAVQRQPARYPGGVRKSDVRFLPGNLETGTRQRRRVIVGRVTAAAPQPFTAPDLSAETARKSKTATARHYFKERSNQRVQGPLEDRPSDPQCVDYNPPLVPSAISSSRVPPPLASPAASANLVLSGSFKSQDLYATMPGPVPAVPGWRGLPVIRKPNARLAHLTASMEAGLAVGAGGGGWQKPESAPAPAPVAQIDANPEFPPQRAGLTRLGATRHPETREMVQVLDSRAASFCSPEERFQSTSRGLDLTWQKQEKVMATAVHEKRIMRRSANILQQEAKTTHVADQENRLQTGRAAAVAGQHKRYADQVSIRESFTARKR